MKLTRAFYLAALCLLLLAPVATGQTEYPNLKRDAEESGQAFISGDFNKLVDFTYPKLVELIGGRAKLIAALEQGVKEMKSQGAEVLSYSAAEPTEIKKIDGQLFAVLPTIMKMKVPKGKLVGKSFMIGVSSDDGEHWTFIGGGYLDEQQMKILLPSAAGKLKLPREEKPTLVTEP